MLGSTWAMLCATSGANVPRSPDWPIQTVKPSVADALLLTWRIWLRSMVIVSGYCARATDAALQPGVGAAQAAD